jgi:hypothetical protein
MQDKRRKKPRNPKFKQDGAEQKPSDRLRQDPIEGTSGQTVLKLDKDGKRLKQSKLRMEKTGKRLDAAKAKLAAQKPYKPPGLLKTLSRALTYEAAGVAHKEVSKYERDNVGLEAAHSLEQGAEDAGRRLTRYAKRRARTRPRRQAAKFERKHIKASADHRLREMAQENPELRKNAFKRYIQKRRLKQQYQKQAKQAAKRGAAKTAEKTAGAVDKLSRTIAGLVKRHPTAAVVILLAFLLVLILQSCMSGAFTIGSGLGGGVGGTSYLAEDADINLAELRYTEWETDLLINAKNPPSGYDEYRYNIGNIGHNPFELLAFLTAVYDDFTFSSVEAVLRDIFTAQYTLSREATTETRGDGEDAVTVRNSPPR